jgi:hypothetical protein
MDRTGHTHMGWIEGKYKQKKKASHCRRRRSLIAATNASGKMAIRHTTSLLLLCSHFSGSTALQAFPRPDRRIETPTRAGRVKASRFISGHRRLGLDTAEHDGTLVGSRPAFLPSLPGLAFGRSCCPIRVTVLSAVGCAPLQHLVRSTGAARSTASSHAGAAQRPPPQSSAPSPRRATNGSTCDAGSQLMPRLECLPRGRARLSARRHGE